MAAAAAAAVGGFGVAWGIVLAANSAPIHPGASALRSGALPTPNAANCSAGTCWDAADKYGYGTCTSGAHVLGGVVRGAEVRVGGTCYKSIYVNLDANSGLCVGIMMFWAIVTARVWERALLAAWAGEARWAIVAALACGVPSWYYSWKMCFVYVNESLHFALRSQLFFTVTETLLLWIAATHIRRSDAVKERWVSVGVATSFYHILQLTLDENGGVHSSARNLLLCAGDCALLYGLYGLLPPLKRAVWLRTAALVLVSELVVFQTAFADKASFTVL